MNIKKFKNSKISDIFNKTLVFLLFVGSVAAKITKYLKKEIQLKY